MRFCPLDQCEHYGKATKYQRKCYYEPQCWRGFMDEIIDLIKLARRENAKNMHNDTSKE